LGFFKKLGLQHLDSELFYQRDIWLI